jgi:hypothetical protein
MAVIGGRSPLYPLIIVAGCAAGFVAGGMSAALFGGDQGFDAFNAVYGLTIGGLIAGGLLEFGTPLVMAAAALAGLVAPGNGANGAGDAGWLDAGRLSLVGRMLRGLIVLLGLAAAAVGLWFGTRPAADLLAAPAPVALIALVIAAVPALIGLSMAGGALARHLDLTVE